MCHGSQAGKKWIADLQQAAALANCPNTTAGCDPQTYIDEALSEMFKRLFGLVAQPGVGGGDGETASAIGEEFRNTITRGPTTIRGRQAWSDVQVQ